MAREKLDSGVFEAPIRPDLIHTVVVAQMAARRQGSAATKNRALVSGGGRKPHRQKGTGRARQGTIRAVQFKAGGVVFGPQPRSYAQHVPKKVRKAALRSALSLRHGEGHVKVVAEFQLPEPKTRHVAAGLAKLELDDVLIVTRERDLELERAARNLPRVRVLTVSGLNVRDVIARKHLLLVGDAVEGVVERLQ
jgi:large subunit ribosomal protein L4